MRLFLKGGPGHNDAAKRFWGALSTACALLASVAAAHAQDFGIHFLGNTTDSVTGTAGVVPIGFWNNIAPGPATTTITGSDGTTTATLIFSGGQADNAWDSGLAGDGTNMSLMDGTLDAGAYGGSPAMITVSNLGSAYYNVYIYTFTDQSRPDNGGDWLPNYAVNGTIYYTAVLGNSGSSEYDTNNMVVGGDGFTNFVEGTVFLANSNAKLNSTNFGNYIEIATVQASGGVITVSPEANGTTWRSPCNGIELVPTAAPAVPILKAPTESPSIANLGVGAGTVVTLGGSAVGAQPISYQWQTDGGRGNSPTNLPGATASNLVVNTTGWLPGTYVYDYVASNSAAAVTSSTVTIVVAATSPTPAISVQFQGNSGSVTLTPSEVAGFIPEQYWNVDNQATGSTATNLVDSSGNPTAAGIAVTYANGQYHSSDSSSTPDDFLMSGGFWSGAGFTVAVTGVPYSNYNVYVYMLNDNNPNRRYGLTLGNQTYWGSVFNGNIYSAPPFTLDTQTTQLTEGAQMQADVVEFGDVTGSSFTITGQTPDGTVAMMGVEIVNPAAGPAVAQAITISAGGTTLYQGESVTLTEFPYGAAPLSYQWLTDNGTGGALTSIPGATNSTLSLPTSLEAGNYNYEVIVSNALATSTSAVVTVTITASEPVLVTDISPTPADEAYVGQTVTYAPVFAGSQPITYQWTVDKGTGPTNILSSSNPTAVTSTLVLSNVQLSDAGTYTLTANNSLGSVSSSSSALAVLPVPPAPAPNTYGAAVLSDGPVAYWRFNEDEDPSTDVLPAYDATGHGFIGLYGQNSQNGFDGIVGPQPPAFPGFETNDFALGTETDLTNSWVTIPALNLNTNTVTITMWIYPTANEPASAGLLMNRPFGAGLCFGGELNASGMAELGYTWNTNAASTWGYNSGLYPLANQWSFVALVIQPASATIYLYYIDPNTGKPDLYSAVSAVPNGPAPFNTPSTIGTDPNSPAEQLTRAFTGSIDEVAVFNTALTSSQLLAVFGEATGVSAIAPTASAPGESPSGAVLPGTSVTLTASAAGTPPFSYQWQTDGGSGGALTNISGATNATLSLNTTGWQIGTYNYDYVVSNAYGTNVSPEVAVTLVSVAMLDIGSATPAPGPNDISQLLNTDQNDDGFNYYTDNGANNNKWNGQTFTTGSNSGGYVLTSLAWKSAGNGNSFGVYQLYDLYLYALSANGASATVLASYQGDGGGIEGDWFQWVGLDVPLSANTVYAYAFGRDSSATGWEHIGDQGGNPYPGGQLCQIPAAGGLVTYGNTGNSDATFDIGLQAVSPPTVGISSGPGGNLTLSWSQGTLLQTTNLAGPWVTNSAATSPYKIDPTNAQMFFKLLNP